LKIGSIYVFNTPVGECSISLPPSFLHFAFQNFEEGGKKQQKVLPSVATDQEKSGKRGGGGSQTFVFLGWQKKT